MKRILNFHRNKDDNCKTVMTWFEKSDTLMWNKKTNTVIFFRHEGELGECKNVDNMNIRNVAMYHDKRYIEV